MGWRNLQRRERDGPWAGEGVLSTSAGSSRDGFRDHRAAGSEFPHFTITRGYLPNYLPQPAENSRRTELPVSCDSRKRPDIHFLPITLLVCCFILLPFWALPWTGLTALNCLPKDLKQAKRIQNPVVSLINRVMPPSRFKVLQKATTEDWGNRDQSHLDSGAARSCF